MKKLVYLHRRSKLLHFMVLFLFVKKQKMLFFFVHFILVFVKPKIGIKSNMTRVFGLVVSSFFLLL